jgi:hypothetical protein
VPLEIALAGVSPCRGNLVNAFVVFCCMIHGLTFPDGKQVARYPRP